MSEINDGPHDTSCKMLEMFVTTGAAKCVNALLGEKQEHVLWSTRLSCVVLLKYLTILCLPQSSQGQ